MMHVLPVDIRASEGTLDYALEIRFADIGRDKEIKTDYQKEIISDMSRLALSLISEIENGQILFGEDAEIVDKQATIIPFIEEFTHVLTGVQLNVTIRLPYNWSACDIPADYSPNITDNPDTGSGILTKIGVYNDGDFVGYTSFLDFSDDFNVTVNGNKIEVTLVGGGGGGAGTLQETTDLGNTTTNDIELIDAAELLFGAGGGVLLDNASRLREGTIDAGTGGSKGIAQICGVGYELKWEAGSQYVMNGNGDNIRVVNYKFNIVPSATDDSSSGFYVGSRWILDNGDIYVCTDSTIGAAVWEVETYADWNAASGSRVIANKPTIPTLTSDLTNDGEDGTNPFITALDLGSYGDMFKSTYDTDNDGIVDKAETIQIIVRNSTGSTLTKGQVVYLSGATGNRPNAVLAQADTEASSDKTIGIVVANIANNADGQVAVSGTLHDLNTNSFAAGDAVWLSATTAGAFTVTPPAEPNHTVFIGYIARAHPTQGRIVIAIQNGYELDDIHGVSITTPATNDYLYYASDGLWKNKALTKSDVGLNNVDNTSDANKPVSTATQTALNLKENSIAAGTTLQYWRGDKSWQTLPIAIYLELVRTGSTVPTSSTRYAAEGLAGLATSIAITISPKKLFTTFRVFITTAQPASGTLVVSRKFYNVAGTEIGSQNLTIAANSVAGIYEFTGATYDMSATNGSYGFTIVNNATSASGNLNSIESAYQ
jgi:hypothetical protein